MSFIGRALGGRMESKVADFSALSGASFGAMAKAGVAVNYASAMRVSAVYACVRVLAEGIAQLPLKLYQEQDDDSKKLLKKHPLYNKLWRKPNDFQTSFEWRETMMLHAALTPGAYNVISRNSAGQVLELLPLLPSQVVIKQDVEYGITYDVSDRRGFIKTFQQDSILHIHGASWNGFSGIDTVNGAKDAIGLAIASEESLSRLHSNGIRPSAVFGHKDKLEPKERDRIKASIMEGYSGLGNVFKSIFLDSGITFTPMSMTPVDSQTHESRKHQIEEICRYFRVFPQMIGYGDKTSTYASAEQFFMAHVTHTLMPWAIRIEQVLEARLLTQDERDQGFIVRFNFGALLRGDAKSRAEYYGSGILNGWLNRNDARRLEEMDPGEGLDEFLVPANMLTLKEKDVALKKSLGADQITAAAAVGIDQKRLIEALIEGACLNVTPRLEYKIGRVLSMVNEGRLRQARNLIDEVVKQVEDENEDAVAA